MVSYFNHLSFPSFLTQTPRHRKNLFQWQITSPSSSSIFTWKVRCTRPPGFSASCSHETFSLGDPCSFHFFSEWCFFYLLKYKLGLLQYPQNFQFKTSINVKINVSLQTWGLCEFRVYSQQFHETKHLTLVTLIKQQFMHNSPAFISSLITYLLTMLHFKSAMLLQTLQQIT